MYIYYLYLYFKFLILNICIYTGEGFNVLYLLGVVRVVHYFPDNLKE